MGIGSLLQTNRAFHGALRLLRVLALMVVVLTTGWVAADSAPTEVVFGPKVYTRGNGPAPVVTDSFTVAADVTAPFRLGVENGAVAAAGARRASSVRVHINGDEIIDGDDWRGNGSIIEKSVKLRNGVNTITVRLGGNSGSAIRVRILGTPKPTVPTSLTPNPLTLSAGATGTLTATLSPPPRSAGVLIATSSRSRVATVTRRIAFSAGQTSVEVPVTAISRGRTTVKVSLENNHSHHNRHDDSDDDDDDDRNGRSARATVNVIDAAPPTLTSLLPAALMLTQGASGSLTLTLNSAAAQNTTITLASSEPAVARVPASILVPAGQRQATVPVDGLGVGISQVSANLNGSTVSSQVTVNQAPPTVVSLLPVTANVVIGASTNLMLTLSAAQATDTIVSISVAPPGLVTAPARVIVPAGQTTAAIAVNGVALGQAGVTASLNGSSASAVVNVIAPPVAVVSLVPSPFNMNVGAASAFTVTINATQTSNTVVNLAVDNPAALQVPATVTIAQGQLSAEFTATAQAAGDAVITASANGTSQSAKVHVAPQPAAIVSLLPNPLPLQQGVTGSLTVTLNVAQEDATTVTLTSSNPAIAQVPASINIAAGQITAVVPVDALTPGTVDVTATVTAGGNTTTSTAQVQVTPPPPVVTGITAATLTLPKGTPGSLRVTVSRAPNAATEVTLSSSNTAAASVPPTVNIAAGALFADFPVAANAEGQATISATLNGASVSSVVTVTPAEVTALTLTPQTPGVAIGQTVPFTATAAMTDGSNQNLTTQVTWTSSDTTTASIANTGIATALAAGQTTITASYTFTAVQTGQSVTISNSTLLTVQAPGALTLSAPVTALQPGLGTTVTINSPDPAPSGGLQVSLTQSGTGSGVFPATVVVPAGQNSASFTFTASAAGSVTLTASAPGRQPGTLALTIAQVLSITAINPASGPPGSTVTITGAGFVATPAGNQVSFAGNNAPAQVLTANATQMTVTVPNTAQTGPITVTNTNGTATSPPFTVTQREQDYQLVVSPANVTVYQGASGSAQAQIASTGTKPFTSLVTVAVQGLPAGVTATISPAATLSAFQVGAINFTATATAAPGNTTVTVLATASDGGSTLNRSATVNLTVAAATGVTGVKGRFVTPEGQGIAGVIVRADVGTPPQPQTTTDPAGNFTLTGLPGGQVTLRFDATPANPLYPIWPYSVTLVANQVNVMPDWTINPPPSNDKFTAINNATQDQLITDDRYRGLSIKLPAGVTIQGWDGVPKTRIAVERVTLDKLPVSPPPVPMRETYQLYFGTPMGGIPSQPIPVTLPNVSELEPGDQTDIWYFDGSPMGGTGEWKIAGKGTVSPDGKTVVSNPGVGIPRFCGVCGLLGLSPSMHSWV